MIDKYYSLLYNDYKIKKKKSLIVNPVMIPAEITVPKQKIVFDDTPFDLDEKVNSFIKEVTEKGYKIISISGNVTRQEYYHYTTTIIYG